MTPAVAIRAVAGPGADALVPALADLLVDSVAHGASVGFMAPLAPARAEAFWAGVAAAAGRGDRLLYVAESGGAVVGTVQLNLALPENQPHRAELSKLLVHSRARRRGIGAALMRAAEAGARDAGRTLLVLDTATDEADRLYRRQGWIAAGAIPGYALMPDGRPAATTFFYRVLPAAERAAVAPPQASS